MFNPSGPVYLLAAVGVVTAPPSDSTNEAMPEPVRFFAPGDPKGQPRPRAFVRKMGAQFVARVYDAGTAEGWKGSVALVAREVLSGRSFGGPLAVELTFYFRRPKGHVNSKGMLKPAAPRFHTSKPDADNAAKAVLDALTQLGAWSDDSQVSDLRVRKEYAAPSDPAGALVVISELVEGAKLNMDEQRALNPTAAGSNPAAPALPLSEEVANG